MIMQRMNPVYKRCSYDAEEPSTTSESAPMPFQMLRVGTAQLWQGISQRLCMLRRHFCQFVKSPQKPNFECTERDTARVDSAKQLL